MMALSLPGLDSPRIVAGPDNRPSPGDGVCQVETSCLTAFACLPGGERLVSKIARSGISPRRLWEASAQETAGLLRITRAEALQLLSGKDRISPSREIEELRLAGIQVCSPWDAAYPSALRTIAHPPALLYFRGTLGRLGDLGVAVVGSRSSTAYGRKIAGDIACGLAQAGVTVISGVARGIDACAHRGALKGGGVTVGVLGCGLDVVYPAEHANLYEEIGETGSLISEYPPDAHPLARRFPARNRIISGLSRAVVVVEAGETSGALITANHALDQGREVFVVPGSVYSPASRGTHRLLKDGAVPVCSAEEVLQELGLGESRGIKKTHGLASARKAAEIPLSREEEAVLSSVPWTATHIDEIAVQAGLAAAATMAALLMLEMKGLVLCEKGKRYLRVH